MPIDTSMYRPYQPPESPDWAAERQKMISLRQMMEQEPLKRELLQQQVRNAQQQHQAGQQGIQENQLKIEAQQRAQASATLYQKTLAKHAGDPEKAFRDVEFLQGADPAYLKVIKDGHIATLKAYGELNDADLKREQVKGELMGTLLARVGAMPETDYAGNYPSVARAIKEIHPEFDLPEQPVPKAALLQQLGLPMQMNATYLANETNQRAGEKHDAELPGVKADAQGKQLGIAARGAQTIANQPQWDAFRASLPAEIQAQIPPMFSPQAAEQVRRLGMTVSEQTAADDRDATRSQSDRHHTENNALTREGHKLTERGQNLTDKRARDLATSQAKTPEAYKKDSVALGNIRDAVSGYRTKLDSYDRLVRPGTPEYAELETTFTNLQMRIKDAYSLGAITGPDMALLDKAVTSPTGLKGRYSGKESLQAQVNEFEKILNSSEDNLRKGYNQPPRGTQPAGGGGGQVTVTDPNGEAHTFPDQASADRFKKLAGIK